MSYEDVTTLRWRVQKLERLVHMLLGAPCDVGELCESPAWSCGWKRCNGISDHERFRPARTDKSRPDEMWKWRGCA